MNKVEIVETANSAKVETYQEKVDKLCAKMLSKEIDALELSKEMDNLNKERATAIVAEQEPIVLAIKAEMENLTFKVNYLQSALVEIGENINSYGISEIAGIKLVGGKTLSGLGEKRNRAPNHKTSEYTGRYEIAYNGKKAVLVPANFDTFQDVIDEIDKQLGTTLADENDGNSMFRVFSEKLVANKIKGYTVTVKNIDSTKVDIKESNESGEERIIALA